MVDKFMLFDDVSDNEDETEKSKIKSKDTIYSIHALKMMHLTIISMAEYNYMKDLYGKLSIPYIKKFKKILDKISVSIYEEKDKQIFFEIVDTIFPKFPISTFDMTHVIEDLFVNCKLDLTDDQKTTASNIYNFMYNGEQMHLIEGFAGTGKTSLIAEIVSHLIKNNLIKSIAFSAPTNKAVNVINEKFDPLLANLPEIEKKQGTIVDFLTIHKLLKYKTDYSIDGKMIFVKQKGSTFSTYDLVIIDECSMLDKKIVKDIKQEITKEKEEKSNFIKIILIGDPAQLPPVNEDNSDIFDIFDKKEKSLMKQVVRSGKDSIVGVCNNVRKWLFNEIPNPALADYKGEGVYLFRNSYQKKREKYKNFTDYIAINKWFKSFLNNPDGIILAWTNKRVDIYNKEIRKIKFGKSSNKNLERFELGDKLILTDFYLAPAKSKDKEQTPFYTSEQVEVINISENIIKFKEMKVEFSEILDKVKNSIHIKHIAHKTIEQINNKTSRSYMVYILTCKRSNCKEKLTYDIHILKDDSIDKNIMEKDIASKKINELIKYYKNFHKDQIYQIEKLVVRDLWKNFNKTFIDPFARVNYGFSTTVHKSQASSYNNVYVDVDDILSNHKMMEGQRCIYTAMTRSVENLYLLI